MNKVNVIGVISAALFALSSNTATASLISLDWKTAGDGLITYDTESGLDWLDITVTQGLSKSYVLGELGTGGAYEGFSYSANGSEFYTLMEHAGFDILDPVAPPGVVPYFHSLLGCTQIFNPDHCASTGMHSAASGGPDNYDLTITTIHDLLNPEIDQWYFSNAVPGYENYPGELYLYGTPDVGSYLLRTHVPIPPALWLFGSGLLGLVGMARRKAK